MCPKRTFDSILSTTDLCASTTYGHIKGFTPSHSIPPRDKLTVNTYSVPGVIGYTGHRDAQGITDKPVTRNSTFIEKSPPGYTGFIPYAASNSLFGKSFSVISTACARNIHRS